MNSKMLLEVEKPVVGIYDYADFVHLLRINVSYIWKILKHTIITNKATTLIKFMIFTSLLSLGGLPPIPWFSTKMNCHSSHNYKEYSTTGNNCGSNIINHPIVLPEYLLLKFYNFEHRTKWKLEIPQK
jgi:hypothetical protein